MKLHLLRAFLLIFASFLSQGNASGQESSDDQLVSITKILMNFLPDASNEQYFSHTDTDKFSYFHSTMSVQEIAEKMKQNFLSGEKIGSSLQVTGVGAQAYSASKNIILKENGYRWKLIISPEETGSRVRVEKLSSKIAGKGILRIVPPDRKILHPLK
jgi:hypothetical protein